MKRGVTMIFLIVLLAGMLRLSNYAAAANEDFSADLLWEADTYTPVWYCGKNLPVVQSHIKVAAIPYLVSTGAAISSSKLVYEWFLNYKKNINASGTGKRFFVFRVQDYDDQIVKLRVSNQGGTMLFEKTIILSADRIKPKILFYKEDPLEGPKYNAALQKEFQMTEQDIIIRAEPFFFSKKDLGKLSYKWMLNGKESEPEEFVNMLSLRAGEEPGRSALGLRIINPASILQFAENALNIIWGY